MESLVYTRDPFLLALPTSNQGARTVTITITSLDTLQGFPENIATSVAQALVGATFPAYNNGLVADRQLIYVKNKSLTCVAVEAGLVIDYLATKGIPAERYASTETIANLRKQLFGFPLGSFTTE